MAITYEQVCQLALTWPGVVPGHAYGGPSLHVGRKFLGRLREDAETFVLKVDLAERESLLTTAPDTFFLTDHYRVHPLVLINLLAVDHATLSRLIEHAWRSLAGKRIVAAHDARLVSSRSGRRG